MNLKQISLLLATILVLGCNNAKSLPAKLSDSKAPTSNNKASTGSLMMGRPARAFYASVDGQVSQDSVINTSKIVMADSAVKDVQAKEINTADMPTPAKNVAKKVFSGEKVWEATVSGDLTWPFASPGMKNTHGSAIKLYFSPSTGELITAHLVAGR